MIDPSSSLPRSGLVQQVGSSNGGQRPSLNSGFPFRRGWPIRSIKMTLALSIIALCISVAAFTLSVIKHFQGERSSKYLQHRNSLVLAKSLLHEAIVLRERARRIDHDILDDSFEVIESLTDKIGDMASRISMFDPLNQSLDVFYQLETKIHSLGIEVASWQSTVEGIAGFWGDNNNPKIEQAASSNH